MTPNEIERVLSFAAEKAAAEKKDAVINALLTAYHAGGFSRCKDFPDSLDKAFPELFGKSKDGGVKADNWRQAKAAMAARVAAFNAAKKNKERFGGKR